MSEGHPTALVLLAEGAEEMETTITVDVLRRAEVATTVAGVEGRDAVRCSRAVRLVPDVGVDEVRGGFDVLALPGGRGGAERLAASPTVGELLRGQWRAGRLVAAICAAPSALVEHGIAPGAAMTCHPSVHEVVAAHGQHRDEPVVEDGPLITSQGPGTAFEFALAVVARLRGPEAANALRGPMRLGR